MQYRIKRATGSTQTKPAVNGHLQSHAQIEDRKVAAAIVTKVTSLRGTYHSLQER